MVETWGNSGESAGLGMVTSPWVGTKWRHLLITDVDNTLFDFGLYAEFGLRAILKEACALLDLSKEDAIVEVREAFRKFNSIEIPFAYEELKSLHGLSFQERHSISVHLATAFWAEARKRLIPYPAVVSTMHHLWMNGTAIVAVTDAPMWEVWRKLKHLRILRYFAGVVAVGSLSRRRDPIMQAHDIPDYDKPFRSAGRFYRLLDDTDRKPSPLSYQYVLNEFPISKDRVVVVGDSPRKDLLPARELGLAAYWAAYGERRRDLETSLQSVTPFEPPEAVRSQLDVARTLEFPSLSSFGDLESIIKVSQPRLPLDC
jgi:putative hydrolase of the HAD superfamily